MVGEKKKFINIKLNEDMHQKLKMQSVKEKKSMHDIIVELISGYISQKDKEIILEPLDEEDRMYLEEGKDDIVNGDYEPMDKVFKELRQG
ncbi:MAG: plasmid partition protein ParG [Candidatus Eremiobacterota bacterium]